MEGAKDPDEYVIKYGNAKFKMLVQNAISLVEFKVKMLKKDLDLNNVNDKIRFLKEIAKLLSSIESKIEQELYISRISEEYRISKEAIYAEVNKTSNNKQGINILEKSKPIIKHNRTSNITLAEENRENTVISLLLKNGAETYNIIKEHITEKDFKSDINRKIVEKLFNEFESGTQNVNVNEIFQEEELVNKISEILVEDYEVKDVRKAIESIINIYEKEKLINRRNEILSKITKADKDTVKNLEIELQEVLKKLAPKK